ERRLPERRDVHGNGRLVQAPLHDRAPELISPSEADLGDRAQRLDLLEAADDGRDARLAPGRQTIPDPFLRSDARYLVGQAFRHGRGRLGLLAVEVEVLDLPGLRLEAVAAGEVVVVVLDARPHAAGGAG